MGINISDILTGGVDKIVDSVGNAIDKIVTSAEEKMILQNALEEIKLNASLQVLEQQGCQLYYDKDDLEDDLETLASFDDMENSR